MNKDEINARNLQQYYACGYHGEHVALGYEDNVMGFNYLIELIAQKLAERTKLKV